MAKRLKTRRQPPKLGGWLHVKAIDTDPGAAITLQPLNKVRRRYVQMVEGRALRIYKDAETARSAARDRSGDAQKALATLLLYETIFLRPGGEKFAAEFGKNAKFVMQLISQHSTWFIAAEDESTFKKWLRVVATNMDSSAVCDKFSWAVEQRTESPKFRRMNSELQAISNFYRNSHTDGSESPAGASASRDNAAAGDGFLGAADAPCQDTEAAMRSAGLGVPESAGLLGAMRVSRTDNYSANLRQDSATAKQQESVYQRLRRFLLRDQVLHVYGSIYKQLTTCYDILGFEHDGKRFKELSEDIKSATYTVPLRTPQHEVDAEATIIGSRIVAASVKLQLSKKGGGGGGGPGENVFKLSCSNPWLVDQLTACKRHMVTTLMTLPHPKRSEHFWSSLGKVEVDLTTMSKHLLKAMKQLQTPSAAQLAPRNFPIRGSVGSVFRPRLPNNMAIEFSIHKCNLVLSAYELQQSRPGHGAGKTKVMFNRHVHDIVANSNARFPVDSLQEVEKILRQSYSDCQSLLQRVLAFKSAYTMNPRRNEKMHDEPMRIPNPTSASASPFLQASEQSSQQQGAKAASADPLAEEDEDAAMSTTEARWREFRSNAATNQFSNWVASPRKPLVTKYGRANDDNLDGGGSKES